MVDAPVAPTTHFLRTASFLTGARCPDLRGFFGPFCCCRSPPGLQTENSGETGGWSLAHEFPFAVAKRPSLFRSIRWAVVARN
jgi:hypothetical protein